MHMMHARKALTNVTFITFYFVCFASFGGERKESCVVYFTRKFVRIKVILMTRKSIRNVRMCDRKMQSLDKRQFVQNELMRNFGCLSIFDARIKWIVLRFYEWILVIWTILIDICIGLSMGFSFQSFYIYLKNVMLG